MKENKEKRHSQKRSKGIVNPFLDDKIHRRLSKAVARVEELFNPMKEESKKRDKDD